MREYLTADDGYLWTNGTIFGSVIYLADGESKDKYYLIPMAEYEKLMQAMEEYENIMMGGNM